MIDVTIRPVEAADWDQWRHMRVTLWPEATGPDDDLDMRTYLKAESMTALVAVAEGRLIGFVEANIRLYADGCETRNVGYIEGWFVREEYRRQSVGAALVRAAEEWARAKGCREMASDCHEENEVSIRAHGALGYEQKERLVHFGKTL